MIQELADSENKEVINVNQSDLVARLIPCGVLLLVLFITPESPRWLAKIGKQREFDAAVRKLRGEEIDVSEEAAEIRIRILNLFFSQNYEN
uniref:Major facilitator superfamily (MFS) profile domain-containing protein n=1 Tax=Lactuca sativa TaxID=4236 RepID=A0A9R1UJV8_LACSA|nr:hypothetical protein LSAT_V11C900486560 [Lactuca sativa]